MMMPHVHFSFGENIITLLLYSNHASSNSERCWAVNESPDPKLLTKLLHRSQNRTVLLAARKPGRRAGVYLQYVCLFTCLVCQNDEGFLFLCAFCLFDSVFHIHCSVLSSPAQPRRFSGNCNKY